jgi:tetratricopeptide (TPR) repeat protein
MTVDRNEPSGADGRPRIPIFRPLGPGGPGAAPSIPRLRDVPCFLRSSPLFLRSTPLFVRWSPTLGGSAPADPVRGGGSTGGLTTLDAPEGHGAALTVSAHRPQFARFAAALRARLRTVDPEFLRWGAGVPIENAGAVAAAETAGSSDSARSARLLLWIERLVAARHGLGRSVALSAAAMAFVVALFAIFEPSEGRVGRSAARAPELAADLVPASRLADAHPSTQDAHDPPVPDTLLATAAPRLASIEAGDARSAGGHDTEPSPAPVRLDASAPGAERENEASRASSALTAAPAAGEVDRKLDVSTPSEAKGAAVPVASHAPDPAGPSLAATAKLEEIGTVPSGSIAPFEVENEDPLYELGYRLERKGKIAAAIAAYEMAAKANPEHAATYYNWGHLLQQRGDDEAAMRKYQQALRINPREAFAHYDLGYILQKRGNYRDAMKHYQAAIAADPSFVWSYYNLGYLEQKLGHYRAAMANYHKSIEINPEHALSYENIATILRYHRAELRRADAVVSLNDHSH